MCINPRLHPDGLLTPCHQCWQCRENRINDWVGRCIAERETCLAATTVTLTYGGGDCAQSRFLRKSDLTSYFKAIRNDGHKIRYFAVGEYGKKKGRAHFHAVIFWETPAPFRELRKNISDEWWPHGFSYWDECHLGSIRYAMKYLNKDAEDKAALQSMSMSKKPMLGSQYFWELAGRYVEAGISPQKPFYKFRDVLDKHGKPVEFYMPPLVAEKFISGFIAQWAARYPERRHWPPSDLVDKYHDKAAADLSPLYRVPYRRGESPWMLPPPGFLMRFDEPMNCHYASNGSDRLWWSFDEKGKRAWQKNLVTAAQAERLSLPAKQAD